MAEKPISQAKLRLLEQIKRNGPCVAIDLAKALGLTEVAIRQHLNALGQAGLVTQKRSIPKGRGRPCVLWSLSELAVGLFPDRHGELTVSLIAAIRDVTGQQGLDAILEARSKRQIDDYRTTVAAGNSLNEQVHALANRRSAEGYMAEVARDEVGNLLLIEHHCPICEAAKSCTGLCSAELNVFQKTLGENVEVKRAEHLLSGDQRCVYRIRNTL